MGRSPLIVSGAAYGYRGSMLVLHHDFTSLRSAVAVQRCQRLVDAGRVIVFRGVDVLGIDATIPTTLELQADFHAAVDAARALGLDARAPRLRPPTVGAHLVTEVALARGVAAAWRQAVHVAYFIDGLDIGDVSVLEVLARSIGLDVPEVTRALGDRQRVGAVRRRMGADRQRGVGGVPVLEFDGTLLSAEVDDARLEQLAALSAEPRH
ncbi:MAG: DsbA family protein [Nitriliruptoraceae bacterium]